MPLPIELQKYIPLEKSWMIRMGMLDLQTDKSDVRTYLQDHKSELGDDLLALLRVLKQWGSTTPIDVGESGTLFRFVRYLQMISGNTQQVITHGTLKSRTLTDNESIPSLSIEQLLALDSGTSQWASAAVLFTNVALPDSGTTPYHLQMSVEAKAAWESGWKPRIDKTIALQAEAYVDWLQSGKVDFTPVQSEDFPFAVAFGILTINEGEQRWPQLRNHETDRIAEMERLLDRPVIDSPDHRVVQALAMRYPDRQFTTVAKKAVNKTWPQFWQFLEACQTYLYT